MPRCCGAVFLPPPPCAHHRRPHSHSQHRVLAERLSGSSFGNVVEAGNIAAPIPEASRRKGLPDDALLLKRTVPNLAQCLGCLHRSHVRGRTLSPMGRSQKVVSVLHPSPNLSDPVFNPAVDIEANPFGPSAGWAVPLFAPSLGRAGRLYAIYTFNEGNITEMPDSNTTCR